MSQNISGSTTTTWPGFQIKYLNCEAGIGLIQEISKVTTMTVSNMSETFENLNIKSGRAYRRHRSTKSQISSKWYFIKCVTVMKMLAFSGRSGDDIIYGILLKESSQVFAGKTDTTI